MTDLDSPPMATPVVEAAEYKMPKTKVGRIVNWRPVGDPPNSRPTPMIVTKIGFNAINGSLMIEDRTGFRPISGVRHISDPDTKNPMFEASGTWEETEDTKLLETLAELVGERHG